jgi:hypothetical protein
LSPLICPLCRKKFDPAKAKKLHVDRPDTVDENRENDLLQRLAVAAEAPEDQLQELVNEVDVWLDTRAEDTVCDIISSNWLLSDPLTIVPLLEASSSDADKISRTQEIWIDFGERALRDTYAL